MRGLADAPLPFQSAVAGSSAAMASPLSGIRPLGSNCRPEHGLRNSARSSGRVRESRLLAIRRSASPCLWPSQSPHQKPADRTSQKMSVASRRCRDGPARLERHRPEQLRCRVGPGSDWSIGSMNEVGRLAMARQIPRRRSRHDDPVIMDATSSSARDGASATIHAISSRQVSSCKAG